MDIINMVNDLMNLDTYDIDDCFRFPDDPVNIIKIEGGEYYKVSDIKNIISKHFLKGA